MDSLIGAAAQALAAGDPLLALKRVALREDGPALALRGIAMAQIGDLALARDLLRRAGRAFGPREAVARARCVVAEAEIALVSRDLAWRPNALDGARAVLERRGDRANAAHAACLAARRLLLLGRLDDAEQALAGVDASVLPSAVKVAYELAGAGMAIRRLRARPALAALDRARHAAEAAGIASLRAEVEAVSRLATQPMARVVARGRQRLVRLDEVEALLASDALVVDACRNLTRYAGTTVSLATRPVLGALARALAEAWPADASRKDLLLKAFRAREADESHRARLRVEIGRLRAELAGLARVRATPRGFELSPEDAREVLVLAPIADERHAAVLALLADGEAWSSSALALALGVSPRSVQRALAQLARDGKACSFGHGRALRWMAAPVPGFPTTLLLPAAPAVG